MSMVCLGPADIDRVTAKAKPAENAAMVIFFMVGLQTEGCLAPGGMLALYSTLGARGHMAKAATQLPRDSQGWRLSLDAYNPRLLLRPCRGASPGATSQLEEV